MWSIENQPTFWRNIFPSSSDLTLLHLGRIGVEDGTYKFLRTAGIDLRTKWRQIKKKKQFSLQNIYGQNGCGKRNIFVFAIYEYQCEYEDYCL